MQIQNANANTKYKHKEENLNFSFRTIDSKLASVMKEKKFENMWICEYF